MQLRHLFRRWTRELFAPAEVLREVYEAYKRLLAHDKKCLEIIADLEDIHYGGALADWARVHGLLRGLRFTTAQLVASLQQMRPRAYDELDEALERIWTAIDAAMTPPSLDPNAPMLLSLADAAERPGLAGGKAHNLGRVARIAQETGANVPPGFVVTTAASRRFLDENGLSRVVDEMLAHVDVEDAARLREISTQLRELILDASIPEDIRGRMEAELERQAVSDWAVRSSAAAEDSASSFAGQYDSVLNVAPQGVHDAYRQVLASKYEPRAIAYRVRAGLSEEETPMAVLMLAMVDARASGVVYTADPTRTCGDAPCLAIYAVRGLGDKLVDGTVGAEPVLFHRADLDAPSTHPESAPLARNEAVRLARAGMALEEAFDAPQDIEWCLDRNGDLQLVQSRPLTVLRDDRLDRLTPVDLPNEVLLHEGETASPGQAFGRIYHCRGVAEEIPDRSILVTVSLPPQLVDLMPRLSGVLAMQGSRASHFASVAREFGIPVLVRTGEDILELPEGEEVSLDAVSRMLYRGRVEGYPERPGRERPGGESPSQRRLAVVMEHVSPLHLRDPASDEFDPAHCSSIHDVVRFCHEKGTHEMFASAGKGRGLSRARRISTDLPFDIYLLDLGGALRQKADPDGDVAPADLSRTPFADIWQGLTAPGVRWDNTLKHMDWERFDQVSAGVGASSDRSLASYVVAAADYCHLMLRFGYHFAVVDALIDPEAENEAANYASLRFKGGGASYEGRMRRIAFMREVLEEYGFTCQNRGDMFDARLARRCAADTRQALAVVGLLLARTRLMDMALGSDEQVARLIRDFLNEAGRTLSLSDATD
jgi:pyruvate,water dikinase